MEDFNRQWDQEKYVNFRQMIHTYHQWTDDAYNERDEKQSIKKWRKIFGDEFARGADVLTEEVSAALVPIASVQVSRFGDAVATVKAMGRAILSSVRSNLPWVQPPPFVMAQQTTTVAVRATVHDAENGPSRGTLSSGEFIPRSKHIRFAATTITGVPFTSKEYDVQWQVVNTDTAAGHAKQLRGGFYPSKPRAVRWEHTEYRGIHWVEAFLILKRTGSCVGRSGRFFVIIE